MGLCRTLTSGGKTMSAPNRGVLVIARDRLVSVVAAADLEHLPRPGFRAQQLLTVLRVLSPPLGHFVPDG